VTVKGRNRISKVLKEELGYVSNRLVKANKMETLEGDTLAEMINNMDMTNWDMTTNFISVFKLILETATAFQVPQSQMPQMLIVISDMQFDSAASNASKNITAWEALSEMYREKGYARPTRIRHLRDNDSGME